ncbi:MAG: hypothetical protein ABMB14_04695 [Myxococcota bacterium]
MIAWALLGACHQPESEVTPDLCPDGTDLTWDSFGHGFVVGWCTSCHSPLLSGPARGGAPVGVDFDTYASVTKYAARISATATGSSPSMPPGGGPPDAERARLREWLDCGLPGPPAVDEVPCDGAVIPGDLTLTSADDVAAMCAAGDSVEGTLTIGVGGTIDCLCAVGGDLVVTTPDDTVELPRLAAVTGAVVVTDSPSLAVLRTPALASAASLSLARNPALAITDWRALTVVAGPVTFTDDGVGGPLLLDGLVTLPADLRFADLPRLRSVELLRLETVAGSLDLSNLGAVAVDLGPIRTVGGDVRVASLPSLDAFDGLRVTTAIGGSLTFDDLPLLGSLSTGYALTEVGGGLILRGMPGLAAIDGFDVLASVGGDVVLAGFGVQSLELFPALTAITGAVELTDHPELREVVHLAADPTVAGLSIERNPKLATVERLGWSSVGGPVVVCDDPALDSVDGLVGVTAITGDLTVCRNRTLADVHGLGQLDSVGGDLTITDNPSLPTDDANALAASVAVDGVVTISGNQ